jgi:hypothetical protein
MYDLGCLCLQGRLAVSHNKIVRPAFSRRRIQFAKISTHYYGFSLSSYFDQLFHLCICDLKDVQ